MSSPREETQFSWPPRAQPDAPPLSNRISPPQPQRSSLQNALESIESDLLGRVSLSFDRWAVQSGWEPDAYSRYCWRCAGNVGLHEQDGEGCASCRKRKLPWDRAIRLGLYDAELREEILALKFNGWRSGGVGLGRILGERIAAQLETAQIPPDQARLVPIPMNPVRRLSRGIDHTLTLSRVASKVSGVQMQRVLKTKYRPEQVGLSATARAANIKGAFSPHPGKTRRVTNRKMGSIRVWVLIDDVRTTGATFVAASKSLRRWLKSLEGPNSAPEIWVASVAVSKPKDRRPEADAETETAINSVSHRENKPSQMPTEQR